MSNKCELEVIGTKNKTDKASWCHDYMPAYDRFFSPLKNEPLTILEIGVSGGSSLRTWRDYFPNAKIYGIDIDPNSEKLTKGEFKIFLGDQKNKSFLDNCITEIGRPDIIIDDGGHTASQQITSFEILFPQLKDDGLYAIEDLHCSYVRKFMDQEKTGLSFLQDLVMAPNFYGKYPRDKEALGSKKLHCEYMGGYEPSYYERWVKGLHFYRSICFIEKEDGLK